MNLTTKGILAGLPKFQARNIVSNQIVPCYRAAAIARFVAGFARQRVADFEVSIRGTDGQKETSHATGSGAFHFRNTTKNIFLHAVFFCVTSR